MATVRVAVNGYGTIGKRVADAVAGQPDLKLVGVAKTRPSFEAEIAVRKGYPLFVSGQGNLEPFHAAKIPIAGSLSDLLAGSDVVVDCAPDKVGRDNAQRYKAAGIRAIFQGGEAADIAESSFSALANYDASKGRKTLRIVSCNTTGIVRAVSVLGGRFGIEEWDATIVRRAADPPESHKGPVDGILPTFRLPSHHGPDVQSIYPDLRISTTAVVVPTTLMHVHVNRVRLRRAPQHLPEVLEAFRSTPRFHIFRPWEGVEGTPQAMEFARDRGAGRPDFMENVLWEAGFGLQGSELRFFQAVHQESIVVPENIDAIRAMFELAPSAAESIRMTDRALGIGS